jgi:5'-deoxynucleotidase YfbR-like HD superfamily hydrolase
MEIETLVDYVIEANKVRDVSRYAHLPKQYQNNVAEHCFMMTILADKLMDSFNLNLDFRKVVRYIYLHDWGEIGKTCDIPHHLKKDRAVIKAQEAEKAKESLSQFGLVTDIADYTEYNRNNNDEAKFVNALDKLECSLFYIKNGIHNVTAGGGGYSAEQLIADETARANKVLVDFPKLEPLWNAIKDRMIEQASEKHN